MWGGIDTMEKSLEIPRYSQNSEEVDASLIFQTHNPGSIFYNA